MIALESVGKISPIFLTVLLIIYLIIAELGSNKVKKSLKPIIIVLIIIFLIVAIIDVLSKL